MHGNTFSITLLIKSFMHNAIIPIINASISHSGKFTGYEKTFRYITNKYLTLYAR